MESLVLDVRLTFKVVVLVQNNNCPALFFQLSDESVDEIVLNALTAKSTMTGWLADTWWKLERMRKYRARHGGGLFAFCG